MKEIPLTQGKVAIVDDDMFDYLNQRKWRFHDDGYAVRTNANQGHIYMHREIMKTPTGMDTDHINHNGLDNRRINLRVCTTEENMKNQFAHKNNTSGYKGVTFNKNANKWQAQIRVKHTRIYPGYFSTPEEAAHAYDDAAKLYHGNFAKLNFA